MNSAPLLPPSVSNMDSSNPGDGSPSDVAVGTGPASPAAQPPQSARPVLESSLQRSLVLNFFVPALILAAGIGVVLAFGSVEPAEKREDDQSMAGRLKRLPSAEVTQVLSLASIDKPLELRVDGVVVPFREIQVASEVSGRIVKKSAACETGSFVTKGELLVEIDDTDYQQEVERLTRMREQDYQALAEVDQELANTKRLVEIATQDVQLQEREVKRLESMPSGFASAGELDRARKVLLTATQGRIGFENQMNLLAARRKKLEAAERLATTELRGAEINLERTRIYSPVDGVVVRENAELNSFIQRGNPIVTLEDVSKAEVAVNLRMDQLQWVLDQRRGNPDRRMTTGGAETASGDRPELPASNQLEYSLPPTPAIIEFEITGRSDKTYRWDGTLVRYQGVGLDARSRTVPVVIVVDQPRHFKGDDSQPMESRSPSPLVRGMFVNVRLLVQPQTNLVAIPAEAIQPGNRILQFIPDDLVVSQASPGARTSTSPASVAVPASASTPSSADLGGFDASRWRTGRVIVRQRVVPVDSLWLSFADEENPRLVSTDAGAATQRNQEDIAGERTSLATQEHRYWVCEIPGNQVHGGDWIVRSPLRDFDTELKVRVPAADLIPFD